MVLPYSIGEPPGIECEESECVKGKRVSKRHEAYHQYVMAFERNRGYIGKHKMSFQCHGLMRAYAD